MLGNLIVPAGFAIVDDLAGSIAPGDSDQFTLRMLTSALGALSGTVHFINNDSDENPFNFTVSGAVQNKLPQNKPEITITLGGRSLSTRRRTVKFGKATVGGTGPTKTYTVRNDGNGTPNLAGIFVPRAFAVVDRRPSSLSPGQIGPFSIPLITT